MTTVAHNQAQASGAPTQGAPATGAPVKGSKLGVPQRPQVNLLPPEVTHRRQAASAQRRMIWTIFGTIILIAVAFGGAFLVRADAALQQEKALATADDLLQQKRELSPVIEVMDNITATQTARTFVLMPEVNWASYTYALAAVLPDDVTINTMDVISVAPTEGTEDGSDALTTDSIGVMTFEATSMSLPDASEWIDAVESVPGLADMNLQSTELVDESGDLSYQVTATVQVTYDALSLRGFADLLAEAAAAAEADAGGDADTDADVSTDESGE